MYVLAPLTGERLKVLQDFERTTGLRVLALTSLEVEPAPIGSDVLQDLQGLEKELGLCLVAVR